MGEFVPGLKNSTYGPTYLLKRSNGANATPQELQVSVGKCGGARGALRSVRSVERGTEGGWDGANAAPQGLQVSVGRRGEACRGVAKCEKYGSVAWKAAGRGCR